MDFLIGRRFYFEKRLQPKHARLNFQIDEKTKQIVDVSEVEVPEQEVLEPVYEIVNEIDEQLEVKTNG